MQIYYIDKIEISKILGGEMMRLGPMDIYSEHLIKNNFSKKSLLTGLIGASEVNEYRSMVKRNQALVHEDLRTDHLYYVKKGIVSFKQGSHTFAFIGAGHFVGFETLLMNNRSRYTARILEASDIYIFDRLEVMEYLFSLQEGWIFFYLLEKSARDKLLQHQHFMSFKGIDRLEVMLLDLAKTFGTTQGNNIVLPKCFTKSRLANYTNFSLNTITSLIKELHHIEFLAPAEEDMLFRINKKK